MSLTRRGFVAGWGAVALAPRAFGAGPGRLVVVTAPGTVPARPTRPATAFCGQWDGPFDPSAAGYEHWCVTFGEPRPSLWAATNFRRNGFLLAPSDVFAVSLIVDEALAWLRRQPMGRPVGLVVRFPEPREPLVGDRAAEAALGAGHRGLLVAETDRLRAGWAAQWGRQGARQATSRR